MAQSVAPPRIGSFHFMSARAILVECLSYARRSQSCSEFVGREGHERPPFSSLPGCDGRAASFPLRPAGAERVRVRWGLPRSGTGFVGVWTALLRRGSSAKGLR